MQTQCLRPVTCGGAKLGVDPCPNTIDTCGAASHARNATLIPSATAEKISLDAPAEPVSLAFMAETRNPGFNSSGFCIKVMRGVGMLGIGGAIAPGNAANAGYQGSPGMKIDRSQSFQLLCKAPEMALVKLRSHGVFSGAAD